jgi:Cof subfamily protein (haloacid dehalogenase superfamily)
MTSQIRLVAMDLDGTTMNSQLVVTPPIIAQIKRCVEKGVRIVFATTRNPDYVRALCQQLGVNDPMICSNGAQILASPDGAVWAHHLIPQDIALTIAQLADERGWCLGVTLSTMTYWRQRDDQTLGEITPNYTIVATNAEAITAAPVRILCKEPDAIHTILELCHAQYADTCRTEIFYEPDGSLHSLVLVAPQADKGTALRLVLERLNIDAQQAMAIGDNQNDTPMFAVAGISVAMGNALDNIKRQAKIIAPDNDHDGVAWALQNYV